VSDEKTAYINYFKIKEGAIIQGQVLELKKKLEELKKRDPFIYKNF
jgi:hypothetical protein